MSSPALLSQEAAEEIIERVAYNAHNLGEFGRMIRIEYVGDILKDMVARTKMVEQ